MLFALGANGQQPDSLKKDILTLRASKPTTIVEVFPKDCVLWVGAPNNVTIRVSGKYKKFKPRLIGGKILGSDSTYTIHVSDGIQATLTVYSIRPNSKAKLVYSKKYTVNRIPQPVVSICRVGADSTIDKKQLIEENNIVVKSDHYKAYFEIHGFDMVYTLNGEMDTLKSASHTFTPEMRRVIHQLTPGTMLSFENIRYWGPKHRMETHPENVTIFIAETNKYKYGWAKTAADRIKE